MVNGPAGARPTGRRRATTIAIVAMSGAAAIGLLLAVVTSGERDEVADEAPSAAGSSAPSPDGAASVPVTFLPDAAHVDLPAEPGCDQLAFHSAMAMWNPALADEMLAADCPFPFDPESIDMSGGQEDPAIAAAFEPRRFQQVFDLLAAERAGVCAVTRLGEESAHGFVWGFEVRAQSGGCADNQPDLAIRVCEYATRSHRDEAAHALPAERALVLGRWTIELDGATSDLRQALLDLGASTLT